MTAATTENGVAAAVTTSPVTDKGAKAMLRLWLILTTNNKLLPLLLQASAAGNPPTAPFYPRSDDPTKPDLTKPDPSNPETVLHWGQLYTALTAGVANPSSEFQPAILQKYLNDHLAQTAADVKGKPTFDVYGQPLKNSKGQALTYGDVYSAACQAFDGFWPPFLTWGHPSPETFGEITS